VSSNKKRGVRTTQGGSRNGKQQKEDVLKKRAFKENKILQIYWPWKELDYAVQWNGLDEAILGKGLNLFSFKEKKPIQYTRHCHTSLV